MLKIQNDLSKFLDEVKPILLKEPSLNSSLLGLLLRLKIQQKTAVFLGMYKDIVAVQTDSHRPLLISRGKEGDLVDLAEILIKNGYRFPGVVTVLPDADIFAKTWERILGQKIKLGLNLRLFELNKVVWPQKPSGSFRLANENDIELLLKWMKNFRDEATPHDPLLSREELIERLTDGLKRNCHYLWEDKGEVVCWVSNGRDTDNEGWIAPVYTPENKRGKGYASALVAQVSQIILDRGKVALLFTDLANPISNSIYQKIGYKPLGDSRHWIFESSGVQNES